MVLARMRPIYGGLVLEMAQSVRFAPRRVRILVEERCLATQCVRWKRRGSSDAVRWYDFGRRLYTMPPYVSSLSDIRTIASAMIETARQQ